VGDNSPILVVDDDTVIRELLVTALEDAGYPALGVHDGIAALAAVPRHHPRLILLDLRMPVLNGWEFMESYRALPGTYAPIVAMTAGQNAATKARELGVAGWIAKPFDLDKVIATVARLIGPPVRPS
jgi:CheY-like chemotaxis protein